MMKKKLLLCIVLATLLVSLCGCHGKRGISDFEIVEEFDTGRDYEITFWAKNDTNKAQIAVYQEAIDSFMEIYPNIHVNVRWYTDYKRIYNDVITNIATNTTPNVCITYPDHVATYLTGTNTVISLDELLTDEKYGLGGSEVRFDSPTLNEIVPQFIEECEFNNHTYCLPYMRSTEVVYINKTMVEQLGYEVPDVLNWDFIWEVSEKAMEKDEDGNYKINGQKTLIPFIYKSTDNMMISLLKQMGADYSDETGKIMLFNDAAKEILFNIAKYTGEGCFSTFTRDGYPGNFLNAGQCIFGIDSTAGATWMGPDAPNMDIDRSTVRDFEMVVRMLPQVDEENPYMISQGPSICVFNKADNQEAMASWLFAQFLLTNEVQINYSKTEGYVPVTLKAQQSEAYQQYLAATGSDNNEHYYAKIDAAKILIDNADNTFTTAVFNGSASLREAAGELIERVVSSTNKKETIDNDYMITLFDNVTKLKRLDQIGIVLSEVELGELPNASKILIGSLIGVWAILAGYVIKEKIKEKKSKNC